jgi:hypothetical protein
MTSLNRIEIMRLFDQLERLEKGITVIAKETDQKKNERNIKLFTAIISDCKLKIDKERDVTAGKLMEKEAK